MSAPQPNHGTDGTPTQARKGGSSGDIVISDELAIALVEKRVFEVKTECGRKIIIIAVEKKAAR